MKPQCWTDSLFLCVSILTGRKKERTFHGSLGCGDLTLYYLQDLLPTWKRKNFLKREGGKAKDQHIVSPPSLTGASKPPVAWNKKKEPQSLFMSSRLYGNYRVDSRRAWPRLLGSPGTKAEGDPQFCGCRSPSVSALPGPKGISESCSLTNLPGTFFLQHSFMHLYPPPTLQDSGGEEVQTLVSL